MQPVPIDSAGKSRLRFVFSETVVSRNLGVDATLEDIAWTFEALGPRHRGHPIAIDVTLAMPRGELASQQRPGDPSTALLVKGSTR